MVQNPETLLVHALAELFRSTVSGGLQRKTATSCFKWATLYRTMAKPIVGPFSDKYHPWVRAMHDSESPLNVGQKAAQMGFTEVALNRVFFAMDVRGTSCLYVLPSNRPDASDFSTARFDVALDLSEHLASMFSDTRNVGLKRAGAASLYIRGSRARGPLKSLPVGLIIFDEVDEMSPENIKLAEARTDGQMEEPQIWKISTPTIPGFGINADFIISNQQHFTFQCPLCDKQTELIFPDCLRITADDRNDPAINKSCIICKECQRELDYSKKYLFLANGQWTVFGDRNSDINGWFINQLYSSATKCHPVNLAKKVLDARVNKSAEQELWNSNMGTPHVVEGAQIEIKTIEEARGGRRKNDPYGTFRHITMGIDQGTWLHYEIGGWKFNQYGNDINMDATLEVLTQGEVASFSDLAQLMRQYKVEMCVMDAQPERRLAYEFACIFHGYVRLCYYTDRFATKMIRLDENSYDMTVDRTIWLDTALQRFSNKSMILPMDISDTYKQHIHNLVRRYGEDRHGNPNSFYVSTGPDHFGHARCYNELALPCCASRVTNENIRSFL